MDIFGESRLCLRRIEDFGTQKTFLKACSAFQTKVVAEIDSSYTCISNSLSLQLFILSLLLYLFSLFLLLFLPWGRVITFVTV